MFEDNELRVKPNRSENPLLGRKINMHHRRHSSSRFEDETPVKAAQVMGSGSCITNAQSISTSSQLSSSVPNTSSLNSKNKDQNERSSGGNEINSADNHNDDIVGISGIQMESNPENLRANVADVNKRLVRSRWIKYTLFAMCVVKCTYYIISPSKKLN